MTIKDIALKNLLRRKTKAAFILAGLVIGVATMVGLVTLTRAMTDDINHKLEKFGANILIVPRTDNLVLSYGGMAVGGVSFDIKPIYQKELASIGSIKNAANDAAVGPILLGAVTVKEHPVLLAGVDFRAAWVLKPWWKISGRQPQSDDVLVGSEAARILKIDLGDEITINHHRLAVSGMLNPTGSQDDQLIFTPLTTAQKILDKPGLVSMAEVAALCKDCPIDAMVVQISAAMPTAKVMAIQQVVKGRMEALGHFKKFSFSLSLVVIIIGGLVVLVTLMGSVRERTQEIGVFRAIGFRQRHVVQLIFVETTLVSILAGLIGYLVGIGGTWLGIFMFNRPSLHAISYDATLAAGAMAIALLVGWVSGVYPAAMAARMDPNQALKTI